MPYSDAAALAAQTAEADSKAFLRRLVFRPRGKRIGDSAEDTSPE